MLMVGDPHERKELIMLAHLLQRGRGLLTVGFIEVEHAEGDLEQQLLHLNSWDPRRKALLQEVRKITMDAHVQCVTSRNLVEGSRCLLQLSGMSAIHVNVLGVGFHEFWEHDPGSAEQLVGIIQNAYALHCGILLFRGWRMFPFHCISPHSHIDVWWLVDDGGLTLLAPHLIVQNPELKSVKLRVLTTSVSGKNVALLFGILKKLRIKAEIPEVDVRVNSNRHLVPSPEILAEYKKRFPQFAGMEEKRIETMRYLHVAELIRRYSSEATLIFV